MARWVAVALALCLLAIAAGGTAGIAASEPTERLEFALAQEFDREQFRIAAYPNGSARWTFHFERTLANDTERRQFEAFAADFNENENQLYTGFRNQSRSLVRQGESVTGRAMAAQGFDHHAFVTTQLNEVGVVEMEFTWTGFARTDGDRVVVGDVFEGGLYVGPDQTLVIRAAGELAFQSVDPPGTLSDESLATSDTVTWAGERSFTDNRPRVVLASSVDTVTTTTSADTGGDDSTASADAGGDDSTAPATAGGGGPTDRTQTSTTEAGSPVWPVLLVLVVIAAASGVFLYQRRGGPVSGPADGDSSRGPMAFDESVLLDDEARIESLLEEHGGRMRQSAIVEATGWSKSKVSMLLSEMEKADQIRKLQVGRENIVSLPGHEPDAANSPHDGDE